MPSDRSSWSAVQLSIRLASFSKIFVVHEQIDEAVKFLQLELKFRDAEGRATGVLLIAPPGSGKTKFVRYLKQLNPPEERDTLTTQPVVSFKVPKSPSPKALGGALLVALGDPLADTGNASEKFDRAAVLLKKVETRVVALDDFQDVPAKRGVRGVEQIAFWIRDLCDVDFPGVVVALGTEQAAVVRDAHDQLLRRMQSRLELTPFSIDTSSQARRFRKLLALIDGKLPLAKSSGLEEPDTMARLYMATSGNLDYLMKLLGKALVRAVVRGSECIESDDLLNGFNDQHRVAAIGGNPFAANYDGEPLRKPGQVFYRFNDDKVDGLAGSAS